VALHNLQDVVLITGLISDEELSEWYKIADLYVSLSLHEGFGVPLVEAMAHDIPVLAWRAGAIPYTVGSGGELLQDRSPKTVSAAMLRIAEDQGLRELILKRQRKAIDRFRLDRQLPHLINALIKAGAPPPLAQEELRSLSANMRFTVTGTCSWNLQSCCHQPWSSCVIGSPISGRRTAHSVGEWSGCRSILRTSLLGETNRRFRV
jgi:hypothetical protein